MSLFFFFQAEDGIRDRNVTGVQTCALPICQPQVALRREGALQVADAAFVGPLPLPASDPPGPAGFPEQAPGHGRDHSRLLSLDRKSTRLNSSHVSISYAVFCLKKKINIIGT